MHRTVKRSNRHAARVEEEAAEEHEGDDDDGGDGQGHVHVGREAGEEGLNREAPVLPSPNHQYLATS